MDIERYTLLVALSLTTLVLVLVFAIFSRIRVARAKKKNEHSAMTERTHVHHANPAPVEGRTTER